MFVYEYLKYYFRYYLYNTVIIELISHDKNEVTQRDLDLAEQIDKIEQS